MKLESIKNMNATELIGLIYNNWHEFNMFEENCCCSVCGGDGKVMTKEERDSIKYWYVCRECAEALKEEEINENRNCKRQEQEMECMDEKDGRKEQSDADDWNPIL